jgi:hypothetical protein
MNFPPLVIAALLLSWVAAASTNPPTAQPISQSTNKADYSAGRAAATTNALDAAQVLAIARAAVATNDTWIDRAEFGTPTQRTNGTWSVTVWRLPKQPGGHRLITVDANGKVTDYVRGR